MTKVTAIEALNAINSFVDWLAEKYQPKILSVHAYAYDTAETAELPAVEIQFEDMGADLRDAVMNAEQFIHGRLGFLGVAGATDLRGPHAAVISRVTFQTRIAE